MLLEQAEQPGEVQERATEAIQFVDDDAVNLAVLDIRHQVSQGRPFRVAAGEAAVVVAVRQTHPTLAFLAGDVRLGALALRIQRVELLLEPFFRALARVDSAVDDRLRCGSSLPHRLMSLLGNFRPKNRYPFQWAPVIAFATAESDR